VPPKGALLIGLYYTTFDNRGLPNVLQPIFLTATGEVKGKVYGVPNAGERVQVVKARRGYAVGGMYIRAGATLDGFRLTFMKIMENGLDTTDKYDGPYIGGLGGGDGTVGGDGNFIVGLHGRTGDKTKIDAICPVSMTSKPPAKK
jgi:hypothetical protein